MKVKHGVHVPFDKETFGSQEIEYWWVGEKVQHGEFNKRLIEQTRMAGQTAGEMLAGLKESISKGIKTEVELELLEKILKGPLCEVCKLMIENMKP